MDVFEYSLIDGSLMGTEPVWRPGRIGRAGILIGTAGGLIIQ
jgi:hypothetical protein